MLSNNFRKTFNKIIIFIALLNVFLFGFVLSKNSLNLPKTKFRA